MMASPFPHAHVLLSGDSVLTYLHPLNLATQTATKYISICTFPRAGLEYYGSKDTENDMIDLDHCFYDLCI